MKTFWQWLKIRECGGAPGVPYVGQSAGGGAGGWWGAVGNGKMASVGDVKIEKKSKKTKHKKKGHKA